MYIGWAKKIFNNYLREGVSEREGGREEGGREGGRGNNYIFKSYLVSTLPNNYLNVTDLCSPIV